MADKITARLVGGTGGAVTKMTQLTLPADGWYGGEDMWAQLVELADTSPFTKIDLQPSAEQLASLHSTALTAENADGIVTVYAFGEKPEADITMQAVLTEVVQV